MRFFVTEVLPYLNVFMSVVLLIFAIWMQRKAKKMRKLVKELEFSTYIFRQAVEGMVERKE